VVGVALVAPGQSGALAIGLFEGQKQLPAFEIPFKVGNMGMVSAVALQLVEHAKKDPKDDVGTGPIGFAIDIEEDNIGIRSDCAFDVAKEDGVFDFALEEFDGSFALVVMGMGTVSKQIGENFEEVRLSRSEEARNPNAHFAVGFGLIHAVEIPLEKLPKVAVELFGNHELVELLPNGGLIELVGLHHTVDRTIDIALEQSLDLHVPSLFQGTSLNAR